MGFNQGWNAAIDPGVDSHSTADNFSIHNFSMLTPL